MGRSSRRADYWGGRHLEVGRTSRALDSLVLGRRPPPDDDGSPCCREDVRKYCPRILLTRRLSVVQRCDECQRYKPDQTTPKGLIGGRVIECPWAVVASDLMSSFRVKDITIFRRLPGPVPVGDSRLSPNQQRIGLQLHRRYHPHTVHKEVSVWQVGNCLIHP